MMNLTEFNLIFLQMFPKMYMRGWLIIGCDAGTLKMRKIKGSHTAMKSGIIAAETIVESIKNKTDLSISVSYTHLTLPTKA